jgi:serine phosphatase RsbU (regulator of sigma subunit)/PAS domain-containing protein
MDLLVEAGAVLATSLDLQTTMSQVADLTVPRLADLCAIDLLAEDGSVRELAVAAADEDVARAMEELRAEFPVDPDGEHPIARVIRSGKPVLLPEVREGVLCPIGQESEHARFLLEHGCHSAAVAPLVARGRTLGALGVLRLGEGPAYNHEDMGIVIELARRAALAIDNARLFSELRGIEQRLEAILVGLAEAVTVMDESGQIVFANQAAADLLGAAGPSELTSARPGTIMPRFLVLDEQGRELGLEAMPSRQLFSGGGASGPLLVRNIVRATGEERWIVARSSPIIDPESGRTIYSVNVFENITEVKRAQVAESFMAEASRVLASSMSLDETLQHVAELAVPQIADLCAVDLLTETGEIERVAVHQRDARRLAMAERLASLYQPTLDEPAGVGNIIRTGRARIFTDLRPDALAGFARDREHLELLLAMQATAMIIVPMIGAGKPIGAITLVSSESLRRLTQADVALAERLGRRAGTAVEHARLYTERTRIAKTLQRALLPELLPEIPGVEMSALYSPAGELNEVGGDFYDVFELDQGGWALVIGDVCGKGPRAASVTALARHTLRAAATSGQVPGEMLQTLHRELRRQPFGMDLCTVCLVTIARSEGRTRLSVSLAGHQPPLLIGRSGEASGLGEPGTLLGVIDPIEIVESEAELQPGETLLLYTDGVVEAGRARGSLAEQGLVELCRQASLLGLSQLLKRIEREALRHSQGTLRDDIALLAVRPSH